MIEGASKELQNKKERNKQTNKDHLLVDQDPCRELSKSMLFRVQSLAQGGLQGLPDYNYNHTGYHDYTGETSQCDSLGGIW